MKRHLGRGNAAILAGCLLAISGCSGAALGPAHRAGAARPGPVRLMSFHGCGDELAALRKAAEASVGPFGLPGAAGPADGTTYRAAAAGAPVAAGASAPGAAAPEAAAPGAGPGAGAPGAGPAYSGTNDYQAGVDEPDQVKTDGRRIVTVAGGVLQVIDAAARTVTGRLDLNAVGDGIAYQPVSLLLSGDHALLLTGGPAVSGGPAVTGGPAGGIASADGIASAGGIASADGIAPQPGYGSRLLLVDLAGQPRVVSSYSIEGRLIDARQVGQTVRVVIGSQPRLIFPEQPNGATDAQRVAANQAVIGRAGLDAWLPHYAEESGGVIMTGHVPCSAVSVPESYSGTSMLSVLTFDLGSDALGSGDGVSIVADGSTVYGTAASLYVASDERWQAAARTSVGGVPGGVPGGGVPGGGVPGGDMPRASAADQLPRTDIYRFDITKPGPPTFAAGGSVPGYLLDQYALSEWQGYLRVATTTGTSWAAADGPPPDARTSSSAVYVLSTRGPVMRLAGQLAGLGLTERIYAVRFIGPVGYLVTFRQTDPLYTLDLSDPARPRVRGSVALTGYSAYLHPASSVRLIGIGRAADAMGHVGGTQVSLFDVSDLAAPTRLATFALASAVSDAEFDPHAFLYWPGSHLVVVPVQASGPVPATPVAPDGSAQQGPLSGALVLRVDDTGITETGFLTQPGTGGAAGFAGFSPIERSVVIGQALWTLSNSGAMASDLSTLRRLAWLPFA